LHIPAKHILFSICSSYSPLKYFVVDIIGLGALFPSPHKKASDVSSEILINSSISPSCPFNNIAGILAQVSALFISVGWSQRPF